MFYVVTKQHRSAYPNPIQLRIGDEILIGEEYNGPECWPGWFFCTTLGQAGGWVPKQVFERDTDGKGYAVEDYSARELDVDEDEILVGAQTLNGWAWCQRLGSAEAGWVPLENLRVADD